MGSPIVQSKGDYLKTLDVPVFLERPEVQAFIGPNFEKFQKIWLKDFAKKGRADRIIARMHWNSIALLGWFVWFPYRKMWGMFYTLTGLFVVSSFFDAYYLQVTGREIPSSAYGGALLALGLMSSGFYFGHVVDFFYKHRDTKPQDLEALIKIKGGTTTVGAFCGVLFALLALAGSSVAAYMIFPNPELTEQLTALKEMM